jgi:hypothetical protein
MKTSARRTGWTGNELIHPDKEAVATDDSNSEDWPDQDCQDNKRQYFLASRYALNLVSITGVIDGHWRVPHSSLAQSSLSVLLNV